MTADQPPKSLLAALVLPEWKCTHVLADFYAYAGMTEHADIRTVVGKFHNKFGNRCCVRVVNVIDRDLTATAHKYMSGPEGVSIFAWSTKTKYVPGTYIAVSAPLQENGSAEDLDVAIDVIEQHIGLTRALWGPRIAWALVQRSIVEIATGKMQDPSEAIIVPNSQNAFWLDEIDRGALLKLLTSSDEGERVWRSLHLLSRATDANEAHRALWCWAAMEVLCDCETEKGIKKKLAQAYGEKGAWKEIGAKFGIRNAAIARHSVAHKGQTVQQPNAVIDYYAALFMDLLTGLYLGKCIRRAERMLSIGFNTDWLKHGHAVLNTLHIAVEHKK